jgi:hypothetical protein
VSTLERFNSIIPRGKWNDTSLSWFGRLPSVHFPSFCEWMLLFKFMQCTEPHELQLLSCSVLRLRKPGLLGVDVITRVFSASTSASNISTWGKKGNFYLGCEARELGADLASSALRGAGFPWGGAWGSRTAHSPLQSATLLSQHYHYLRWPNLHVRRSVTFYIIFYL